MISKLHGFGRKFSQVWQDTVVSRRYFITSWIKKGLMLFLNRLPLISNYQQMTASCTTILRSCNQPSLIVKERTISRETVAQMARPIAWSCSQSPDQSRGLSTRNHARLMVRPSTIGRTIYDLFTTSCDLFAGPEYWTWPMTILRPSLHVRSPTTSEIYRTICPRCICDSSYFVVVGRS